MPLSGNRKITEIDFTETTIRAAWRNRERDLEALGSGSQSRIIANELGGLMSYRASADSLTLVAKFYSATHIKTIQRSLARFTSEEEITPAAIAEARKQAEAMKKKADGAADYDIQAEKTLSENAKKTLQELADIYFNESDHFAGLKGRAAKQRKRAIEIHFLNYATKADGEKAITFGERRRGKKDYFLNAAELKNWRRDKLRQLGADKPFQFNRCRAYTKVMMKWLADNDYMPRDAIISVEPLPEPDKVKVRRVSLGDDMLRALWNATQKLEPVERDFSQMLILSGQRLRIISQLKWSEVRLDSNIPQFQIGFDDPERCKNDLPYALPVTGYMADIIRRQQRIERNPHVFAFGPVKPLSNEHAIKKKLDKLMKAELGADFHDWRFHDLRRTVVDKLSGAGVPPMIRELVIAHSPSWLSGAQKHYDVSSYILEKQDAMEKLHNAIMRAVNPTEFKEADEAKANLLKRLANLSADKLEALASLIR